MSDTPSKPILFVHIGFPKTGTTTIQQFINCNAQAIRDQHIFPCSVDMYFDSDKSLGMPPNDFVTEYWNNPEGPEIVRQRVIDGLKATEGTGSRSLLVSCESLAGPGRSVLFSNLEDIVDMRVICYIRRRDDLILSGWRQWGIKRGRTLDNHIAGWLKKPQATFRSTAEEWHALAGASSMTVKPLHKSALVDEDLLADFASLVGIDIEGFERPPKANISFNQDTSELLRMASGLFDSVHDNLATNFLEKFAADLVADDSAEILGYQRRKEIYDRAYDDHFYMHQTYFPELDFEEIFGVSQYRRRPLRRRYDADAQELAGQSFKVLLKILMEQEKRIKSLEVKLRDKE